jgi:hypothetical protein
MKKLLALLVIIAFTASIVVAVENPFDFSLYNKITLKGQDSSQLGRLPDEESYIGESPLYDYIVDKAVINDEMKCGASITIADIYTLGAFLQGIAEIGTGGDSDRVEFRAGWENGIQAVQDYLKIDINIEFRNRWQAGTYVDYFLLPSLKFSGEVPDSGFSWELGETVELGFNPEYWKDSDPTYHTFDGEVYDSATGALNEDLDGDGTDNDNDGDLPAVGGTPYAQVGVFDHVKFETKLALNFEFFHFFAPENITGTIKLSNIFKATLPYSYYLEISKELVNEFEAGFELGLAGPTVYLAFWGESQDFVNTSAPLDGDLDSHYSWEGRWLGNEGSQDDIGRDLDGDGDVDGDDHELAASWSGDWDDYDATSHARPNLKIGFRLNFTYTKDWFSFGTEYKGYETGLRRYDEDGCNNDLEWVNEFSIFAKFSL